MELEHSFVVPVPKSRAWDVLLDVERVAPCMPGATLDSVDGDEIHGRIKVKVGPINMTYAGTARFVERDEQAGVVTLEASGKETKGAGTASASVRSVLEDRGNETHVLVKTTLSVTGKPAQFGRGVMNEVGGKLLGIFAANLAATLAELEGGPAAEPAAEVQAEPVADGQAVQPEVGGGQALPGAPGNSIDDLSLPSRVTSSLHREGIATLGDLVARTDDQLLAIDGIGPASIVDIKAKLAGLGLALGQPIVTAAIPPEPSALGAPAAGAPSTAGTAAPGTVAPSTAAPAGTAAPAAPAPPSTARAAAHQLEDDAINLIKVAGLPVLKRAIPVMAGLIAAALIGLRHKLRHRKR